MKSAMKTVWVLVVALGVMLSAGHAFADGAAAGKQQGDAAKMVLRVSDDGKALVNQDGQEVARFAEGMQVVAPKAADEKTLPGCMCCKDECIAYDRDAKCVKKVRSCTWNFDCNCQ